MAGENNEDIARAPDAITNLSRGDERQYSIFFSAIKRYNIIYFLSIYKCITSHVCSYHPSKIFFFLLTFCLRMTMDTTSIPFNLALL